MKFVSTRGRAPALSFSDAVLTGLARDGGLYVPETWPQIAPEMIEGMADGGYTAIASAVLRAFIGDDFDAEADRYMRMVIEAYATFRHPSVTPLVEIGPGHYILELFHGPTLAFKDVAMQILARLYDHILGQQRRKQTILCATSGDTGSAVAHAFQSSTDWHTRRPEGV